MDKLRMLGDVYSQRPASNFVRNALGRNEVRYERTPSFYCIVIHKFPGGRFITPLVRSANGHLYINNACTPQLICNYIEVQLLA